MMFFCTHIIFIFENLIMLPSQVKEKKQLAVTAAVEERYLI